MPGSRPSFPHIGWDPTPGDAVDTRTLAKRLGGLETELGTSLSELDRIDCGAWQGAAAKAFVEYIGKDVRPLLDKSHESFGKAARALHRWAGQLEDFQDEADRLERAAGEKLAARDKAQRAVDEAGSSDEKDARDGKSGKGAASHTPDPGKQLARTSGAVDEITSKVHDLEDRYERAAAAIAKDLDKAGDIAPDEPGFWEKLAKGIPEAWNTAGQWIKDHADQIKLIGDLLSDLTGLLGLLAIITLPFPPLAAIFGTAALIASGLALAAHGLAKAGGADVSWVAIAFDAVGLIPGFGGIAKGTKVVGMKAAESTAARLGKGFTAKAAFKQDGELVPMLLSFGKQAKASEGGLRLIPGFLVIQGKLKDVYEVQHAGGLVSRMGGVAKRGYMEGQLVGTKSLKMLAESNPFGLASPLRNLNLDPIGNTARLIDGAIKIAPKTISIPQHIGAALNPGDHFEHAASR